MAFSLEGTEMTEIQDKESISEIYNKEGLKRSPLTNPICCLKCIRKASHEMNLESCVQSKRSFQSGWENRGRNELSA